ncbi:D(1)-like dopamine receptor [Babylonia areolata]|uniref:D(1)-like dopamine receptor n=1 Tax=Babylonia areolata TaxID=304850 RepID=UPI003FCEFFFE
MASNTSIDMESGAVSGSGMDSLMFRDPTDTAMTGQKVAIISILTTSNVFMLLGNGLSIYIILSSHSLRRHTYYWLVLNLAVLDLLNSSIVVPLNIVWEFHGNWPFSQLLCDVEIVLDLGFSTVAAYSTVLLSLDKYIYITKPFFYYTYVGPKMTVGSILVVWSVWITYSAASVFGDLARSTKEYKYAFPLDTCNFVLTHEFAIISFFLVFFIPLVILIFSSSRILCVARQHIRIIQNNHRISDAATNSLDLSVCFNGARNLSSSKTVSAPETSTGMRGSSFREQNTANKKHLNVSTAVQENASSTPTATVTSTDCGGCCRTNTATVTSPQRSKATSKTTSSTFRAFGTVTLVVFAYIIMFAPYWIASVVNLGCVCIEPSVFEDYLAVFYYMHSLVNPYIYMATDRRYKTAIRRLMAKSKLWRRCTRNRRVATTIHVRSVHS